MSISEFHAALLQADGRTLRAIEMRAEKAAQTGACYTPEETAAARLALAWASQMRQNRATA